MSLHKSKRGLDLPISGMPEQRVHEARPVSRVGMLADDFPGMKPRFLAEVGDEVRRGQAVFEDRKRPGVLHTAPAAGRITAIHRGERRALQSVVIELSEGEREGHPKHQEFESYPGTDADMDAGAVRALLVESGAWTHFRTRPFGHTPAVDAIPAAIFVNGMDSNPGAADPDVVVEGQGDALDTGLRAIATLAPGKTFLCTAPGAKLARGLSADVTIEEFSGPHPAGTAGYHVHTLMPAHRGRVVFTITYQEVLAIGMLVQTGTVHSDRIVSLMGPAVKEPRLVATRTGASIEELVSGELGTDAPTRAISGSVLSGSAAVMEAFAYLGRRDAIVSVLEEAGERAFLGWLGAGWNRYSSIPTFLSRFLGKKSFDFDTDTHGSPRAMVPIGMYERVTPWDILPTHLLRALIVGDTEAAEALGALELDEEDVALFSFVCPGKTNYGLILRENLERMFAEG